MSSIIWNPWHGCVKVSEGCQNCYVYYLDGLRGRDAHNISRNKTDFQLPLRRNKQGEFKIPVGTEVQTCFTSDFFIKQADEWRPEVWEMIRQRSDLRFLIPTKRVERFLECIPQDWGEGYDNVAIAVSIENQQQANNRMPLFINLPIKHRIVFLCPLLEYVDLSEYYFANNIELVSVCGESYENARVCDFEWVKKIYCECKIHNVPFLFHQTGSKLQMGDHIFQIPREREFEQAKKAMQYLQSNR